MNNKYKQIFSYLKEFAKLRNKEIYNIESTNKYKPIWLNSLPENEDIYNILRDESDKKEDYWLKFSKPRKPKKPNQIIPPKEIIKWVDNESLYNEDEHPFLKQKIELNGKSLYITDHPELEDILDDYNNSTWLNDLIKFQEDSRKYKNALCQYKENNRIYNEYFKLQEDVKNKSETHELIIAVGLFNYQKDNNSRKHFRHILVQKANIQYKNHNSSIIIKVDDEDPQIEKNVIAKLYYEDSINNAISEFNKAISGDNNYDLLIHSQIGEVISNFSNNVGIEEYQPNIKKPKVSNNRTISYSPALIFRQKDTSKLDEAYTTIIGTLGGNNGKAIPLIDRFIDKSHSSDTSKNNNHNNQKSYPSETLYFPMPYNNEQKEILNRAQRESAIVVQGPPGTGKSHTIANLICHLLANGEKVLVTAYTKRALGVLKDKLPKEYQGLVVSYLGNDQKSKGDLAASVNAIKGELDSKINRKAEITRQEENLNKIKRDIAEDTNKCKEIIQRDTNELKINQEYSGMHVEILEILKSKKEKCSWYKDTFEGFDDEGLEVQLDRFLNLHQEFKFENLKSFKKSAEIEKLPIPEDIDKYNAKKKKFEDIKNEPSNFLEISFSDELNDIKTKITEYWDNIVLILKERKKLRVEKIPECFKNNDEKFIRLKQTIKKLPAKEVLSKIDGIKIDYPKKDLRVLLSHAEVLLDYLKAHNKLQGLGWYRKRLLPPEIKEKYYFVNAVRVNESPCDTVEEFDYVIEDIKIKLVFEELNQTYKYNRTEQQYTNKFDYYLNTIKCVDIYKKDEDCKDKIKKQLNNINITSKGLIDISSNSSKEIQSNINKFLKKINNTIIKIDFESRGNIINNTKKYLDDINCADYNKTIFDNLDKYKEFYTRATKLSEYNSAQQDLIAKIPYTIEYILQGNEVSYHKLKEAIYFHHAKSKLNSLPKETTKTLENRIKNNKIKEKEYIKKIGSDKAWISVSNYLSNNPDLITKLKQWKDAISKVSNTNSKRSRKYRKIAKEKMEQCKEVIPCWIMPLHQLVDTIIPAQGMYDYIIVDEASQLGIDAMLLVYLAKKIIIVGDDKQTSPEYIGVDTDEVDGLIKRELGKIPDNKFYDTQHSFFDLASIYFNETTLREHFRCMPEIIEFSNNLCYKPENKPLYPIRAFSENRLDPLKSTFVKDGYTDGKSSNLSNLPEAEALVGKITEIIADKEYKEKTIGIIVLQGNKQETIIHDLLLEKIDQKEYLKRKIIVGKPAFFQGDERDIIFLSLVTASNHARRALTSMNDIRRFNVAVSRAKDQVWLFHSVQISDIKSKKDLRYKLLEHMLSSTDETKKNKSIQVPDPKPRYGDEPKPPKPFRSWFEVDVYNKILSKGYNVIPAYKVAGYEIDLVPICANGTKIAVECDGDFWHDERYNEDMHRQDILERVGWQFFRIRYSDYLNNTDALNGLWDLLKEHSITPKIIEKTNFQSKSVKESEKKEIKQPAETISIQGVRKKNSTMESEQNNELIYFNIFCNGDYIMSDSTYDKADSILPIDAKYKNGFLLQCYENGHINKYDANKLFFKTKNRKYMNGFNIRTNVEIPKLFLIQKDEIIGVYFIENGKKTFKAHRTEKLPLKDNLAIQGYKVIFNENFREVEYIIIPLTQKNKINRLVFDSFQAKGKDINNNYYKNEWDFLNDLSLYTD